MIFTADQSVVGFDPGATGALAIIDPASWNIAVLDTPNRTVEVSGKNRVEVDPQRLAAIMKRINPRLIVSEKVWSRPGQDSKSVFSLGRARGQIEMASAMGDFPLFEPTPQEWKRRMMVSSDKDLSRTRASALIPAAAHLFSRKKDHNRAEAALLSLFGCFWLGITPGRIAAVSPDIIDNLLGSVS